MKVEPCPGALATVMSPPIMRQRRRLIARPSPVPPYLRVVEASAWVNSSNSFAICSGVIPMPVSEIAMVTQSRPPSSGRRLTSIRIMPRSVNLLALLARLSSAWRSRVGSARIAPTSAGHSTTTWLPFFAASGRIVATTSSTRGPTATDSSVELQLARLDLREIEDVVDQGEQVLARAEDALVSLDLVRLGGGLRVLEEHLACTPMMALSGVRSSWLMLARNCDLWRLATSSSRPLSWISWNRRAFSTATAACAANVWRRSTVCGGIASRLTRLSAERTPTGWPRAIIGMTRRFFVRRAESPE